MKLPTSLMNSMVKLPGFDREAFQHVHESGEQIISIRLNPRKPISSSPNFPISQVVPWSSFGFYLTERPIFTLDPLFHAGVYYVQEASSMFLEHALKQTVDLSQPLRILDLCAAPGGKSTLIQSLINEESLLVSNEVIKTRVNVLQENITKWGGRNVMVTNNDAKDFAGLENYFDAIVVDAPCSGSGLFRKDPHAIEEWSLANVELCSQRQKRILADVYPALKKNGILIYSTCSYSAEEDEEILDWMGDQFDVRSLRFEVRPEWKIVESIAEKSKSYGYRFYPDKLKGEGFFIAALQKLNGEESISRYKKTNLNLPTKKELSIVKDWTRSETNISIFKHQDLAIAIPPTLEGDIPFLQKHLYLKKVGISIGKFTAKELVPDHALAMSDLYAAGIVRVSLNKSTALQYLRRADVFIDVGQKGWVLVDYNGINLGWIKNLGNRINNYYPKDWRILMR
jgi:NOL1/NOP2/sun family putative RNA methylase